MSCRPTLLGQPFWKKAENNTRSESTGVRPVGDPRLGEQYLPHEPQPEQNPRGDRERHEHDRWNHHPHTVAGEQHQVAAQHPSDRPRRPKCRDRRRGVDEYVRRRDRHAPEEKVQREPKPAQHVLDVPAEHDQRSIR